MSLASTPKRPDRSIRIAVTTSDIRKGSVTVRNHLYFFPKSAMAKESNGGAQTEPCVLEIDGFGAVETEIDTKKGIFRWKGWKRVYRDRGIKDGDVLVFTKLAPSRYRVSAERAVLDGMERDSSGTTSTPGMQEPRRPANRCNDLSGDEWLRYSISVWSDIRKTQEEAALKHPAMFPTMLCERLILMFLRRRGSHRILDPFMGSGSTLVAARNLGKTGIGLEINPSYIGMARKRLEAPDLFGPGAPTFELHNADARMMPTTIELRSIDLCITSPPYWDILNQARTADYKDVRHYGNLEKDLGTIKDYEAFLKELQEAFWQVHQVLKPGAYCVVVVMDLRKKNRFYPFHSDLTTKLVDLGFVFDDLIIWDRGHEYNNLRPLGYPSVFRVNKVHEFILLFRKPENP